MTVPCRALVLAAVLFLGSATAAGDPASKIHSTDASEAYAAIQQAAKAKTTALAGDLFEAGWETRHPHLAIACGEALAAIGPEAAEQSDLKKVRAKAIKTKDEHGQRNLARVLGAWDDLGVDDDLAWLASGRRSAEVQAEALAMIGHLTVTKDRPFPKCVLAVTSSFKSPLATVRMAACSAASRIRDPSYVEPLVELAKKAQDEYSGLYAVWALIRMGERGSMSGFLHVLDSEAKRETVNACLKAVVELASPQDAEALLSLSRATKVDYRDGACLAFGRLAKEGAFAPGAPADTTPRIPPALVSKIVDRLLQIVAEDPAYEVRDAANRTLQRIGQPARAAVVEKVPALVQHNEKDVALTAIELSGVFRADGSYKRLFDVAIYEKDPVRRLFAARALGLLNPTLVVEELTQGVAKDKKGRDTTLAMVRALGYVRSEPAYQALIGIAADGTMSEAMRREAEKSLERLTGRRFGRNPERWEAWYAKARTREPFSPHIGKFDRSRNRREAIEKRLYGLTESTERAVENGLRWLEMQQHPEGLWDGNEKGFGGTIGCEPAYTGLSLLAFLGAGYNGASGKYHETIRRASEFLAATQFYDGSYPVTGGGDDSWIFAYLIGMGVWGVTEAYGQASDDALRQPAQSGLDYLARVQTPGAGWRYGPRYTQSDTSCTSWVLMAMKSGTLLGLDVPQRSYDGIDWWLERCQTDITGEEEKPEDLATDYDKEVGAKRHFKAITGYFELQKGAESALQGVSMTAVGMVCRFFMGWQRSHPLEIGMANYLMDFLPQWRKGLEKGQAIAWYFYYWYYGTLAMHQMGGPFWRAWNEKIKSMLPDNQRKDPPALQGSWDPDTALLNGGRLFSTAIACMTLETYYRFSPLMLDTEEDAARRRAEERQGPATGMKGE